MTVEELFSAGAHHTVESLFARGEFAYRDIAAALERRFGAAGISDTSAVASLIQSVTNAQAAAEIVPTLSQPNSLNYGVNPALASRYQYAVIASIPESPGSDKMISVPWTINTDTPLSYADIVARAEEELNAGISRPDYQTEARHSDLLKRDEAINERVRTTYGGNAPFDINIVGSYKRA